MASPRPGPRGVGTHLILDAWGCPPDLMDDVEAIERLVRAAVAAGRATLIDLCVHRFSPLGVTATATLAESHIAIHTWPERGYCGADLFFCSGGDPAAAAAVLIDGVRCERHDLRRLTRFSAPPAAASRSISGT